MLWKEIQGAGQVVWFWGFFWLLATVSSDVLLCLILTRRRCKTGLDEKLPAAVCIKAAE